MKRVLRKNKTPASLVDLLDRGELKELFLAASTPCLSVYMPTHPGGSEQDPIRWKNLLRQVEKQLKGNDRYPQADELLQPMRDLLVDPSFWQSQSEGLAFFHGAGRLRFYRLPLAMPELAVVAERFHLKPLLPLVSGNGRFFVLAISQKQVRLLEGTAHSIHQVNLKNVPSSLADAMRFDDKEEPLLFHTRPAGGKGSWGAIFHGHGVGIDDLKDDLLRYFQQIDRGLHELFREEQAPLILAAVEYLWPLYRRANKYPHLLEQGLAGNPDRLSQQKLQQGACSVVQPYFQEARKKAFALYQQLAGTGRATADLEEIVRAAYQGQVEFLFVPRDQQRWGTFEPSQNNVVLSDGEQGGGEDLYNVAAVHTYLHGGTVYAVQAGEVPGSGPQAAIFWLPLAKRRK